MKSFKQYVESCWKGYTAIGVKKKGGRTVPNCVPVKEDGMGGAVAAVPTNSVGGGNIAGAGVGASGEPGVSKKRKSPVVISMAKRASPKL